MHLVNLVFEGSQKKLPGRRGGEHLSRAVLFNSKYNVYSLQLEFTAIRRISFSCIELLVAT